MLFQLCRAVRIRAAPCFCLIARGVNRRTLHFIINEPSHASLSKRRVFFAQFWRVCAPSVGFMRKFGSFCLHTFGQASCVDPFGYFAPAGMTRRADALHIASVSVCTSAALSRPRLPSHSVFAGAAQTVRHYALADRKAASVHIAKGLPRPIISACPAHVSPPSPRRFAMRKSADFLGRFLPCAK